MNIDSIITEWTYRLEKGYPDSPEDYQELRSVLQEMTDLSVTEQDAIVHRAMGLEEQDEEELDYVITTDSDKTKLKDSLKNYLPGYNINLDALVNAILDHPNREKLINLIENPTTKLLERGAYKIRGIEKDLYDLIQATVKITKGDASELWLAIIFNGQVVGAISDDTTVEADVVNDQGTVSLKNYSEIKFNFGQLPVEGQRLLKDFVNLAELITNQQITVSVTSKSLNPILKMLDNEQNESGIRRFLKMAQETDIPIIQSLKNRIEKFYTLDDNLDKAINNFCDIIDSMLREKIYKVDWWGMIIKQTSTLYLETSENIFNKTKCRNDRLSPAIANFSGGRLFVLGSQLGLGITTKQD